MKVCIAPWAAGHAVLKKLGVVPSEGKFPIKEMTMAEVFEFAGKILEEGYGVMIRPPAPSSDQAKEDSLDYILFVDSARGRFMQR